MTQVRSIAKATKRELSLAERLLGALANPAFLVDDNGSVVFRNARVELVLGSAFALIEALDLATLKQQGISYAGTIWPLDRVLHGEQQCQAIIELHIAGVTKRLLMHAARVVGRHVLVEFQTVSARGSSAADFLLQVLAQAPVGILVANQDGEVVYVNPVFLKHVACPSEHELLGRDARKQPRAFEVVSSSGKVLDSEHWPLSKALYARESTFDLTLGFRFSESTLWRSLSSAPLLAGDTQLGAVLLSRDVSAEFELSQSLSDFNAELSAKADTLAAREQFLNSVLESAPVLVHIVYGSDARSSLLNAAARERFGLSQERYRAVFHSIPLSKAPIPELCDQDGRAFALEAWPVMRALRGEEVAQESLLLRSERNEYRLVGSAVPIRDRQAHAVGAIYVAIDITDRQKQEEQRQRLLARIKEAERLESIGLLAGQLSHEINNVLATILGHADLACEQLELAHPVRADLQAIVSACERASLELLQSLRVTGQNITLKESVDFGQLAASELELYRSKVSDSVHFIVDVHASLPKLRADRAAIRQLMTQLIALAVQDLDQREGEVLVVLRPFNASFDQEPPGALIEGIAPQGSFLELTVIDDGAGTMLAKLKDAFDPVKSLSQSADINLAVVRGTVRAHRGLIYAETAPKHGMRITVLFPIKAEHA